MYQFYAPFAEQLPVMIEIDLWSCIFVHTVEHGRRCKRIQLSLPWGIVSRTPKSADVQGPCKNVEHLQKPKSADGQGPCIKWCSTVSPPYPRMWNPWIERANCIYQFVNIGYMNRRLGSEKEKDGRETRKSAVTK